MGNGGFPFGGHGPKASEGVEVSGGVGRPVAIMFWPIKV